MSAGNFSRRQWMAGVGSITAALASSSCASAVREEKILNLMVHGAFALELSDTELVMRAPALLGHVYGARCGTAWSAPKRKSEFKILGLSSGTSLDHAIYLDRAQQTFPHVKHALLRPELEYWTLRLPIPIDVRGFRQVEARGDETALSGSSLQNPIWKRVPSVLLLRFAVADWKGLALHDTGSGGQTSPVLPVPRNESIAVYAESAFPPAGDEIKRANQCYEPALDLEVAEGGYDFTGPYHDASIGVTATDTKHLHEILSDGGVSESAHAGNYSGCLPIGM